jgi:hypothetical protein
VDEAGFGLDPSTERLGVVQKRTKIGLTHRRMAGHGDMSAPPTSRTGKRHDSRMNIKRMRGRNHRGGGSGSGNGGVVRHHGGGIPMNRNHVFDSNGPDLRIRGTAQQLFEKYLQLGRDATSSGDRVMAEGYFQHAEHYFRILNAMAQAAQQNGPGGQTNGGQSQPRRNSDMETELEDNEAAAGLGDQPIAIETRDGSSAGGPDA